MLDTSHLPIVAGCGTDVAGMREAVSLARRARGVIDHMHSSTLLNHVDVLRGAGMMTIAPQEAKLRADCLLVIGPGFAEAASPFVKGLLTSSAQSEGRRVFWLCPPRDVVRDERLGDGEHELPGLLAAFRARLAGRMVAMKARDIETIDAMLAALKTSRFGVAIWSLAALEPLIIEMLCGLISDLNAQTRFSGLPLWPGQNAAGILQTCAWLTSLPIRTGFAREAAEHDPWRFDTRRMAATGEADCAVWISAYDETEPDWTSKIPAIVLTPRSTPSNRAWEVQIQVGQPGVDHDAVEFSEALGALAFTPSSQASDVPAVATIIRQIASRLRVEPC